MDKKHIGARNEYLAIAHLLSNGYEVFKNVSQHGITDVVAIRGTEIIRADVKGITARPDGSYRRGRLSKEQLAAGIISIGVYPDDAVHIDLAPRRVIPSTSPTPPARRRKK